MKGTYSFIVVLQTVFACFLESLLKNTTWKQLVSPAEKTLNEFLLEHVKSFPSTLYFNSCIRVDRRDGGL